MVLQRTCIFLALCSSGLRLAVCQDSPTWKATSPLVLVQVSPADKHGGFVRGLTPEDFTLLVRDINSRRMGSITITLPDSR